VKFFFSDAKITTLNSNNNQFIREKIFETLTKEAQALENLSKNFTEGTVNAIDAIHNAKGRLIITGIGKSAIVAQKIVATLNSTGTKSLFMHAADAIHGDLGLMNDDDIVLCISKSGDTPEIKVLIPLIRNFGNKVIGMLSNLDSFLAHNADYNIYLPMTMEADPNNLAPTTSTTLQMAMGDAIAISLLSLNGFSQEHFAKFHPGGSLGKKMYLKVSDVIKQHSQPKVYVNDDIKTVIIQISGSRLGATVVVDDNENLVGIITDGDLRRMLESKNMSTPLRAHDIMSKNPKTIQEDVLAIHALEVIKKHSITQLIVLKQNKYKGIIHLHDLIKEGLL